MTKSILFSLSLLLICICKVPSLADAQNMALQQIPATGKQPKDFVPKGYTHLFSKEGDLNKDSLDDVIMVLKNMAEDKLPDTNTTIRYNRILLILFKTEEGYRLAAKTDKLLLCNICGFATEPPDEGNMRIDMGILDLIQTGGHTQQWVSSRKFRFQNGDFYQIGKSYDQSSHYMNVAPCDNGTPGSSYSDINLLTGDRIVDETDDDCKTTHRHDKIKVAPLVKMRDLDLNKELGE